MLISTHNLGSVPDFCDRAVLIDRRVLAAGPTAEVFTQANLERAFGGKLRHFVLGGAALHDDADARRVTVLTDDERPFVIYDTGRTPSRSQARRTTVLLEPFAYSYMVNAIWVSALVGALCAFLSAFLMLKGWSLIGDALSHAIVPGRRRRLHPRPAVHARGVPRRRPRGRRDLRPRRRDPAAPGRGDRRRLHRLLRARPVHDLDPADVA